MHSKTVLLLAWLKLCKCKILNYGAFRTDKWQMDNQFLICFQPHLICGFTEEDDSRCISLIYSSSLYYHNIHYCTAPTPTPDNNVCHHTNIVDGFALTREHIQFCCGCPVLAQEKLSMAVYSLLRPRALARLSSILSGVLNSLGPVLY